MVASEGWEDSSHLYSSLMSLSSPLCCVSDILYLNHTPIRGCSWCLFGTSWRKEESGGGGLGLGTPGLRGPLAPGMAVPRPGSPEVPPLGRGSCGPGDWGVWSPIALSHPMCSPCSKGPSLCFELCTLFIKVQPFQRNQSPLPERSLASGLGELWQIPFMNNLVILEIPL